MKKILFLIFAFFFLVYLSPPKLISEIRIVGPPQSNLGIPHPVEHDFAVTLDDPEGPTKGKKNDMQNEMMQTTRKDGYIWLRYIRLDWFF